MGWDGGENGRGTKSQRGRGKERVEWGRGPWKASLHFCPGAPEFQVTPLSVISWTCWIRLLISNGSRPMSLAGESSS